MEFEEWRAYDSIHPFGDERSDFQAGQIAATVFNVARGKGVEPAKPSDFYVKIPETTLQVENKMRRALTKKGK